MRRQTLSLAALALVVPGTSGGRGQEKDTPAPAARLVAPVAYYAHHEDAKRQVRLSDEMADKLIEIVGRKPKQFVRTTLAAPAGTSWSVASRITSSDSLPLTRAEVIPGTTRFYVASGKNCAKQKTNSTTSRTSSPDGRPGRAAGSSRSSGPPGRTDDDHAGGPTRRREVGRPGA
jgi:hypothetical protein